MQNHLSFLERVGLDPYVDEFLRTNTGSSNPYHDLAHALRVACCAWEGASLVGENPRILAIAGLFHDWGHPGRMGNDPENIARSVAKVRSFPAFQSVMAEAIEGTVFPTPPDFNPTPAQGILRDADFWHTVHLSEEDWLSVQAGLAMEFGKSLPEWLAGNIEYTRTVPVFSEWGEQMARLHRDRLVGQAEKWAYRLLRSAAHDVHSP